MASFPQAGVFPSKDPLNLPLKKIIKLCDFRAAKELRFDLLQFPTPFYL